MAESKTKPTKASVSDFLEAASGGDAQRLKDCKAIVQMMKDASGEKPVMWGTSIVGFGSKPYQGAASSGDWPIIAFSPRKSALTLYVGATGYPKLLAKLGKHTTGKGCLYIKKLSDVDLGTLKTLIATSAKDHAK